MFDKKEFEDFIERLKYHHKGEGVREHGTAAPLFLVQEEKVIYGMDRDYTDDYVWVCSEDRECSYETDDGLLEAIEEDSRETGVVYDDFDLSVDDEITYNGDVVYEKIWLRKQWETVNCHFTKEAAEAFINRKGHDHEKLRIYVATQYWCKEWCNVVHALLSGQITYNENNVDNTDDSEFIENLLAFSRTKGDK